jgi:hypothetical protein
MYQEFGRMTKHLTKDWEFVEEIETSFNEWFHGDYGTFSYRSEAFYTDCEIGDEKTRQDMLKNWIYASFYEGFMRGKYAKLEEEVGLTNNE